MDSRTFGPHLPLWQRDRIANAPRRKPSPSALRQLQTAVQEAAEESEERHAVAGKQVDNRPAVVCWYRPPPGQCWVGPERNVLQRIVQRTAKPVSTESSSGRIASGGALGGGVG